MLGNEKLLFDELYEKTKDCGRVQFVKLLMTKEKENQELKKQLEENKDKINWYENFEINKTIDKLRIKHNNQQKEFIEYLEDLIKQNETVVEVSKYGLPKNCSKLLIDFYKEILQKYKEIIGDKNENI